MNLLTKIVIGGVVALMSTPKGRKILSDAVSNLTNSFTDMGNNAQDTTTKSATANGNTARQSWQP